MKFAQPPSLPRGGNWPRFAIWLLGSLLAAVAVGAVFVQIQKKFAPVLVTPLLCGLAVGGIAAILLRYLGVAGTWRLAAAGCLLGVAAAVSQHYASYWEFTERLRDKLAGSPAALVMEDYLPDSFADYMQQEAAQGRGIGWGEGLKLEGWQLWAMWSVEAFLVIVGTLVVIVPVSRQPYCGTCGSWYRTIREGRLPKAAHKWLAEGCELPQSKQTECTFRLTNCRGGCGPSGLEVSWEGSRKKPSKLPPGKTKVWLEPKQRNELLALLDDQPSAAPAPSSEGPG